MIKPIITLILIICLIVIAIILLGIYLDNIMNKPYTIFSQKALDIYNNMTYDNNYYKDFLDNWLERNKDWYYDSPDDTQ